MKIFHIFKNLSYVLIFGGFLTVFLSINSYFIVLMPGSNGYACIPGANITAPNITFAIIISFMASLLIVGIIDSILNPTACSLGVKTEIFGITGLGSIIGFFTVFCTFCSLPILSIFGLSFSLVFFTTYNLVFKIISIVMLLVGLWQIERK